MESVTELYVLDDEYQILDLIDGFISLIWNKKYYGVGDFELHCGAEYAGLLQQGRYLARKDDEETGIIEELNFSMDASAGKKVVVKGRFLKAELENRVIDTVQNFNNIRAGDALCQLADTFCIHPANTDRKIAKLILGDGADVGGLITTQITGKSLLDAMNSICEEQEISCNILYDFLQDQLIFSVWQGVNRTQEQSDHAFATFSEDFDNVFNVTYNKQYRYRNFAYVAGAGEGQARIVEIVDIRKTGEERHELYVDARDLQRKDANGNDIAEGEYRQALRQRGLEKLKDYQVTETVDSQIDSKSGFIYGVDYDLGDLVTFVDHTMGIMAEQRITEVCECIEAGERRIDAVFGQSKLSIMEKVKKGVI